MTSPSITVEHNGKTYAGQIMRIKATVLGREDHGIATAYLHCEAEGSGIGVGGYGLDAPKRDDDGKFVGRVGTAYGMDHIFAILRTVGVGEWEKLPGQHVIVLYEGKSLLGNVSVGIASLTGDRVLILKEHAAAWLDDAEAKAGA